MDAEKLNSGSIILIALQNYPDSSNEADNIEELSAFIVHALSLLSPLK